MAGFHYARTIVSFNTGVNDALFHQQSLDYKQLTASVDLPESET
jgi:hypothetical protein